MVAPGMPAGTARPSIALIPRWARGHAPGWKPRTFTLMNTEQGHRACHVLYRKERRIGMEFD
jgi:hypothetical protein